MSAGDIVQEPRRVGSKDSWRAAVLVRPQASEAPPPAILFGTPDIAWQRGHAPARWAQPGPGATPIIDAAEHERCNPPDLQESAAYEIIACHAAERRISRAAPTRSTTSISDRPARWPRTGSRSTGRTEHL